MIIENEPYADKYEWLSRGKFEKSYHGELIDNGLKARAMEHSLKETIFKNDPYLSGKSQHFAYDAQIAVDSLRIEKKIANELAIEKEVAYQWSLAEAVKSMHTLKVCTYKESREGANYLWPMEHYPENENIFKIVDISYPVIEGEYAIHNSNIRGRTPDIYLGPVFEFKYLGTCDPDKPNIMENTNVYGNAAGLLLLALTLISLWYLITNLIHLDAKDNNHPIKQQQVKGKFFAALDRFYKDNPHITP
jgi:hypothetical protein